MKNVLLFVTFSIVLVSCLKKNDDDPLKPGPTADNVISNASIGDTLTITGSNFPIAEGSLNIHFGTEKATILSQTAKSISFIVPVIRTQECEITLKTLDNNTLKSSPFTLDPVKITTSSTHAKSGEVVNIQGKNFQYLNNVKVAVNDIEIQPSVIKSTGLSFVMPDLLYPGRNTILSVKDSRLPNSLTTAATVTDKWVRIAYSPFVFRGLFSSFVFKGEGYVLSYDKEGTDKKALFFKLNPTTYKYTTYLLPVTTTDAVATTTDIYCVQDRTDIYRYDIGTGQTAFLGKLPAADAKIFSTLALGADLYLFSAIPHPFATPTDLRFYKYSVASNSWTLMKPFPESRLITPKLTVIGKKIYIINEYRRFYIYDSETNSWTSKPLPINPNGDYVTAYYNHSGKVYALISPGNGQETIFEYAPETEVWKNLGILRKEGSNNFYGFYVGNKHFIGGSKHDPFSSQLFESDSTYIYK